MNLELENLDLLLGVQWDTIQDTAHDLVFYLFIIILYGISFMHCKNCLQNNTEPVQKTLGFQARLLIQNIVKKNFKPAYVFRHRLNAFFLTVSLVLWLKIKWLALVWSTRSLLSRQYVPYCVKRHGRFAPEGNVYTASSPSRALLCLIYLSLLPCVSWYTPGIRIYVISRKAPIK